ncbi:uncharacterized protein Tco025E_00351 [Trypanosoma conorhini]|uniref:Cilia- and flagella-associated protein 58 central coiled coil domain-containing protein n=1 Tax=Trypanosoma conorhini TaxID=83891 RepID=A0A422QBR9_9TRYP|nr:uncharacterized protein Tco025E_00351 [Trypanosoma conorhini]RNF27421.1 hypothetical protein Tco025E_00351 [Trypanosoma conorhini]
MASSSSSAVTGEPPGPVGEPTADVGTFNEIRSDNRNFDYYQRQFQEVLMGLENDEVLEAFRVEYAALHHSFLKSHDGETRLLKKCAELQADIEACVMKVQAAEELTRGDKTTIEALKVEIEKTRKNAVATREREALLKDKVNSLKRELSEIEERVHRPVEATAQEAALQSLVRAHETVLKEKETMEYQLAALRQEFACTARRLERVLEVRRSRDAELRAVTEATEEKLREVEAQKAVRLRREEELRLTREEIARRVVAAQERQTVIERLSQDNARHDVEIKLTLDETARLTESYQQLSRQLQNVNRTCQSRNEENDALQRRMNELMEELKLKESAADSVSRAHRRELKLLDAAARRTAAMEGRRAEAEAARAALHAELALLEDDFEAATRAAEADERRVSAQVRELDLLHDNVLGAAAKAQQQSLWLAEQRTEAYHLEHELRSYEEQAQRQNEVIYKLSRECAGYEENMKLATLQCARIMAEVQDREVQLGVALDEVKDVEARIRQQQALLEAVLSERKTYSKHYAQIRGGVTEMVRGFRLMLAQIKQMQEEVQRRERRLVAEDGGIDALVKQRRKLEAQIAALHLRIDKRGRSVQQYSQEVRRLGDVFAEGEDEVGRQRRRFRDVQKERDFLDNQVYTSNEELARLYEKARVQQSLLQRGESICAERLQTVNELHHRIAQLTEEVGRLRLFVQRLPELRRLVNGASRELVREQNRVRALLHECERPMNLHPNHQLASSDPEAYALTARVGALQRELVARRTELTEKEQRIKQQEASYLQCKAAVARQLGPEIAEQVALYQGNLAKKAGQMRAMVASLKYFREQTELYQARYNELRDTLDGLAEKYAETRQQRDREARREASGGGGCGAAAPLRQPEQPQEYVGYVAPPRGGDHAADAAHDAPSSGGSGSPHREEEGGPGEEAGDGGAEPPA